MSKNQPPLKLDDLGSFMRDLTKPEANRSQPVASSHQVYPSNVIEQRSLKSATDEPSKLESDRVSTSLSEQVLLLQRQLIASQSRINSLQEDLELEGQRVAQRDAKIKALQDESKLLICQLVSVENLQLALEEKERKLFEDLKFLQQESERITAIQAEAAPLIELTNERKKLRSANTRLEKKVGEFEANYLRLETSKDRLKAQFDLAKLQIKSISGEADDLKAEVKAIKGSLTQSTRDRERLKGDLAALQASLNSEMLVRSFATIEWLLESGVENHGTLTDQNVTIAGDGPWEESELLKLLKQLGYKPVRAGSRGSTNNEVIIVGRDADCDLVEAHISNREGKPVKLFPQELFIASVACGSDPFDLIDDDGDEAVVPDFLEAFGQGHPIIEYLLSLQFPWPKFGYDEGEVPPLDQVDESPLVLLGYHVGRVAGMPARERREILKAVFEDDALPRVALPKKECDGYMEKWGSASSRIRLRRMACHIAWLIRKNRKRAGWDQAVADWNHDLAWLKENIYSRVMRFNWPRI